MRTPRREPDAYLHPKQIGAHVWLEQNGALIRTNAHIGTHQTNAVQLFTSAGTKWLNPRQKYAVWFSHPEPYVGDPSAPF